MEKEDMNKGIIVIGMIIFNSFIKNDGIIGMIEVKKICSDYGYVFKDVMNDLIEYRDELINVCSDDVKDDMECFLNGLDDGEENE